MPIMSESGGVLEHLVTQIPAVVANIVTVIYFLTHMRELEKSRKQSEDKIDQVVSNLSETCHAFQRDIAQKNEIVMSKVSEALDKNAVALIRNTYALEKLDGSLSTKGSHQKPRLNMGDNS